MFKRFSQIAINLTALCSTAFAAPNAIHEKWWVEDPTEEYYYVTFKADSDSIATFFELQTQHGWKQDISGHAAGTEQSQVPIIQARLHRKKSPEYDNWRPFPTSKTWFNQIVSKGPVTYEMPTDSDELIKLHTELYKDGFVTGFSRIGDTNKFYNTFYKR